MTFSALLETGVKPAFWIFAGIVLAVVAIVVIPHMVQKHKYEKYQSEHEKERADAKLMFGIPHTCPICNKAYTVTKKKRSVMVERPTFVGGTFLSGLSMDETDTHYTCYECHYNFFLQETVRNVAEYYQDRKYKSSYTYVYDKSFRIQKPSDEIQPRIINAINYKNNIDKMEKDMRGY